MIVGKGDGGWMLYSHWGDDDELVARVRYVIREDGRLEPAEIHVEGPRRLTGDTLRRLPLGHMEAFANGRDRDELIERINSSAAKVERATDRWLTVVGHGNRDMGLHLDSELVQKVRRHVLKLRVPNEPKKPDAFYDRVATLYTMLTEKGSRRPAQEIADANEGVQVSTVHRWIKEARRRGLLGSGRRGKAG